MDTPKPLTVSVHFGAVIPSADGSFGNLKPDVTIDNVDVNGDIDAQISSAIACAEKVFAAIDDKIIEFIDEAAKTTGGGLTISKRIDKIDEVLSRVTKRLSELKGIEKVGDPSAAVAAVR